MTALAKYNLTSSDGTTAAFALGTTIEVKGATYQYFIADGAIAAYALCTVQDDWDAQEGTTTTSGSKPTLCCIPQFAVADNEYFWAPVGPFGPYREDGSTNFKVLALTLCVHDVKLYTTATAGCIDDSATDLVAGLFLNSTNATGGTVATACQAVQRLVTNCQD